MAEGRVPEAGSSSTSIGGLAFGGCLQNTGVPVRCHAVTMSPSTIMCCAAWGPGDVVGGLLSPPHPHTYPQCSEGPAGEGQGGRALEPEVQVQALPLRTYH